jgi:hypothetical protein
MIIFLSNVIQKTFEIKILDMQIQDDNCCYTRLIGSDLLHSHRYTDIRNHLPNQDTLHGRCMLPLHNHLYLKKKHIEWLRVYKLQ